MNDNSLTKTIIIIATTIFLVLIVVYFIIQQQQLDEARRATCRKIDMIYGYQVNDHYCIREYYDMGTGELTSKHLFRMIPSGYRDWRVVMR